MRVNVSYLSHYGKIRRNNEDSLLVHDEIFSEVNMEAPGIKSLESDRLLLAVADGMGGESKGELASRTVLEVLRENLSLFNHRRYFSKLLSHAKNQLNQIVKKDKGSLGLGTTLSGLYLLENRGIVFSCGDSRVYRINNSSIEKLTTDHSLVQGLYDSGYIREEEMRTHPQKNIITSAISGDMTNTKPLVFYEEIMIQKGSKFLICTDGLWESMSSIEMYECITRENMIDKVLSLKDISLKNSGRDNISIVYLEVVE
ncbi:MAG: protein phosphatase 2C domain-containing protein [Spirochaetota bacterium]